MKEYKCLVRQTLKKERRVMGRLTVAVHQDSIKLRLNNNKTRVVLT